MVKICLDIDGVEYRWCGCYGSIIKSKEYGVKVGDVRIIKDILFYAYMVRRNAFENIFKKEISWSIQNVSHEKITKIKEMFLKMD
jgi:hypothetical protein